MTIGPLEYAVVGFEGNRFTGQILAELRAAKEKGIIRIIDLLLIMKDENGDITALELSDLGGEDAEAFGPIAGDLLEVFEPDDVETAASDLPNNSSAALLLIEQTWAIPLEPIRITRQREKRGMDSFTDEEQGVFCRCG